MRMKKQLSVLGILFMLMLKHPPMPRLSIFQKISIVEVRGFLLKGWHFRLWYETKYGKEKLELIKINEINRKNEKNDKFNMKVQFDSNL